MRIDKFKTYLLDFKSERENSILDAETPASASFQESSSYAFTSGSLSHTLSSLPASVSEAGCVFSGEDYTHNESAWR